MTTMSDSDSPGLRYSLDLPKPHQLLRCGEFRQPAPWVARGQRTQLTAAVSGRALPVYLGVDFGTAYTKASVGLLDQNFPVDWSGVNAHVPSYLLPTEYTATSDGRCWLGQLPSARPGDIVSGLKQEFISSTLDPPAVRRAAVFIALVLQYLRASVFENHHAKIGTRPLRWFFNIGTPCNGVDEDGRNAAYKDLQRLAWRLSLLPPDQVNYAVATSLDARRDEELKDLAEHEPVPEFVAQLAAYARSAERRNGLHALVDIGGGTVDMVTFNVHQVDGEDVFPFFVPVVAPLGVFGLLNHRFGSLQINGAASRTPLQDLGDIELFTSEFGVDRAAVFAADSDFARSIGDRFAGVLRATKARRYRNAPEWTEGVRTFVTGGGSASAALVQAIHAAVPDGVAIDWVELPKPAGLLSDGCLPFHRISVAAGLARNPLAFGQIRPAAEVPDDLTQPNVLPRRRWVGHDEIYSR